jgi:hypothetical protein
MASGTIIGESTRFGAALHGIPFDRAADQTWRRGTAFAAAGSGRDATTCRLIEFEIDDHDAPALASALADVLEGSGWYVDFHSPGETSAVS